MATLDHLIHIYSNSGLAKPTNALEYGADGACSASGESKTQHCSAHNLFYTQTYTHTHTFTSRAVYNVRCKTKIVSSLPRAPLWPIGRARWPSTRTTSAISASHAPKTQSGGDDGDMLALNQSVWYYYLGWASLYMCFDLLFDTQAMRITINTYKHTNWHWADCGWRFENCVLVRTSYTHVSLLCSSPVESCGFENI